MGWLEVLGSHLAQTLVVIRVFSSSNYMGLAVILKVFQVFNFPLRRKVVTIGTCSKLAIVLTGHPLGGKVQILSALSIPGKSVLNALLYPCHRFTFQG